MKRKFWPSILAAALAAFFATFLPGRVQALDSPTRPLIYATPDSAFEIFWFYPGLYADTIGNLTENVARDAFPGMADKRFAVLTKFNFQPPLFINSMMTFLTNHDLFPGLPGDQFTPLEMSLRHNFPADDTSFIFRGRLSIDSAAPPSGEIVAFSAGVFISDRNTLWTSQEWLAGYPTAPLVGLNLQGDSLRRYIVSLDDPGFAPLECFEKFIIGLETWNWCGHDRRRIMAGTDSLFFKVRFNTGSGGRLFRTTLMDSIGVDSLRAGIKVSEPGYISIVACANGDEAASDSLYISPAFLPPLEILPPALNGIFAPEKDTLYAISVFNKGDRNMKINLSYDPQKIILDSSSITLEPFQSAQINIRLTSQSTLDTLIGTFVILGHDADGYPLLYRIILERDGMTAAPENSRTLPPDDFLVGNPFPNPFNSHTAIPVISSSGGDLKLEIYDLLGRKIAGETIPPQRKREILWDGCRPDGARLPSGIYFLRIGRNDHSVIRKAVLLN